MFVVSWASDDDSDPTGQLIGAAASAVLFALVTGLFIRSYERRIFQAGGHTLTPEERFTVVHSVDAGRWPDDVRLHPSASRLVDQRLRRTMTPAVEIAVFGLMLAVAVLNVVLNGPWWWLAVVFWAIAGPWSMRSARRSRAGAQALRDAAPARRPQ
ncbi:hypothetical protein AB0C12_09335 [Actinoplanes sp. NPDC048967]|uniref:hypothetical protein n=1 Tax=Actinoplanes sp. NPDC048967 TaxID=3155269 RepID=UPI0033F1CFED